MVLTGSGTLSKVEVDFYTRVMQSLKESGIPFLVGGAYAFARYTEIERHTKDLDLFIEAENWPRIRDVMLRLGYSVELTFPHWLGKAFFGDNFVDIIFGSGNGLAPVDKFWFSRAQRDEVLGVEIDLCPPEEMIWQKAYIMERERFDGADVAHLIKACGPSLDWEHLLMRFDKDFRVLLSHLVLFGFIYPGEQNKIPADVLHLLLERLKFNDIEGGASLPESATLENKIVESERVEKVCGGTILSRAQYLIDVEDWGYQDARIKPLGNMSKEDVVHWTAAIDR
jgi:Uncharacterised nucleotidyltransferase